jgi:ABC-type multidrug transport system ATPase subunit/ABC-type multidrug transport system permease subunit
MELETYSAHGWGAEKTAAEEEAKARCSPVLPSPWQKFYTDDGEPYYYNPSTDFSTWQVPESGGHRHTKSIKSFGHRKNASLSAQVMTHMGRDTHDDSIDFGLSDLTNVSVCFQNLSFYVPATDTSWGDRVRQCLRLQHPLENAALATVLSQVSGVIVPRSMLAIMGPSGCGKSTLLDILAGKKTQSYFGSVFVNGRLRDQKMLFQRIAAYVPQVDELNASLSSYETLWFYINLRLDASILESVKQEQVWNVLEVLGLSSIAHTRIGDSMYRGISGGQKKRLSIAKALLAEPKLLFLDEPTSGLSATDSKLLIDTLRGVCDASGTSIVMVIHQPRASVFRQFDHLLLLSKGLPIYNGPISKVKQYMTETCGLLPSKGVTDADWLLDIISPNSPHQQIQVLRQCFIDHQLSQVHQAVEAELHVLGESKVFRPSVSEMLAETDRPYGYSVTDSWHQFRHLLQYFVTLAARDQAVNQRFINALAISSVIALMFHNSAADVAVKSSVIFLCLICTALSGLDLLPKFVKGRVIFQLDASEGIYDAGPYFWAQSCVSFVVSISSNLAFCSIAYWITGLRPTLYHYCCFLAVIQLSYMVTESVIMLVSICSTTTESASAKASFVLGFGTLFSGLLANPATLTGYVLGLLYCSPLWYAFESLNIIEHGDRDVEYASKALPTTPASTSQQILDLYGISSTDHITMDVIILCCFLSCLRISGYIALKYTNQRQV